MAALMSLSLLFLSLHALCDDAVHTFKVVNPDNWYKNINVWQFGCKRNWERCPASTTKSQLEYGLKRTYLHMVLYHKHTRLISGRGHYKEIYPVIDTEYVFLYEGNLTSDYAVGVYFLVLRSGEERKNESPVSNPYVRDEKTIYFDDGKRTGKITEMPGTGSDFSRMYYEYPYMFSYFIDHKDRNGTISRIWEYKPESCAKTAHWFANEGFYKLDSDTHELIPIYYHPSATDFFY